MQRTWKRTIIVSLLMSMFAQYAVAQIRALPGSAATKERISITSDHRVKEPGHRIPESRFSSPEQQKIDHMLKHYFEAEVKTGDINRVRADFWSYVNSNPKYASALRRQMFGVNLIGVAIYPSTEEPDNLPWKFLKWLGRVLRGACKKHDIPNCCICDPTEHPKGSCPYCR